MTQQELRARLEALAEPAYRDFQAKLLPDTALPLLGVRLPTLRKLARELVRGQGEGALALPGQGTFEEVMLRGMMVGALFPALPAEAVLAHGAAFIDEIDNWSVCDSFCAGLRPLAMVRPDLVYAFALGYADDPQPYAVRFCLVMLLYFFLDEAHLPQVMQLLAGLQNEHFYVKMARAWALSMCCVRAPEQTLALLRALPDDWVRRKAVQKIRESRQIPREIKDAARALA